MLQQARLHRVVILGSNLLAAVIAIGAWGEWRTFAAIVLLQGARNAMNVLVPRRTQDERALLAIGHGNLLVNVAMGHLVGWTSAALVYMPFQVLVVDTYSRPNAARRVLYTILLPYIMIAAIDGTHPMRLASYGALSVIVWGISVTRAQLLAEAEKKLADVQHRLIARERLAALGVLTAGIAHEINNPMSYVTCNLEALTEDLEALARDPALLADYAKDVVPATLDGVRRVNAIVADLRRFARDDVAPESMVSFDLNAEIATAVRIAGAETRGRCNVRVDLAPVPAVVGRPRQIGQALVNLVVNAAHATCAAHGEGAGVVAISSMVEGDEVLVRVEDEGIGMTSETRAHLRAVLHDEASGRGDRARSLRRPRRHRRAWRHR